MLLIPKWFRDLRRWFCIQDEGYTLGQLGNELGLQTWPHSQNNLSVKNAAVLLKIVSHEQICLHILSNTLTYLKKQYITFDINNVLKCSKSFSNGVKKTLLSLWRQHGQSVYMYIGRVHNLAVFVWFVKCRLFWGLFANTFVGQWSLMVTSHVYYH